MEAATIPEMKKGKNNQKFSKIVKILKPNNSNVKLKAKRLSTFFGYNLLLSLNNIMPSSQMKELVMFKLTRKPMLLAAS